MKVQNNQECSLQIKTLSQLILFKALTNPPWLYFFNFLKTTLTSNSRFRNGLLKSSSYTHQFSTDTRLVRHIKWHRMHTTH